jgi:hypothetical protein
MGLRRTKVDSLIEAKKCYLHYIERDKIKTRHLDLLYLFADKKVIEMWPDEKARKLNIDLFLSKKGVNKLEINKHNQLLEIYATFNT